MIFRKQAHVLQSFLVEHMQGFRLVVNIHNRYIQLPHGDGIYQTRRVVDPQRNLQVGLIRMDTGDRMRRDLIDKNWSNPDLDLAMNAGTDCTGSLLEPVSAGEEVFYRIAKTSSFYR